MFEFSDRTSTSEQTLSCWSEDKQEMQLEVFVQLRINVNNVAEMWAKYSDHYMPIYSKIVTMTVKETAKNFKTSEFFEDRAAVRRKYVKLPLLAAHILTRRRSCRAWRQPLLWQLTRRVSR